jgi:hypothetical protein
MSRLKLLVLLSSMIVAPLVFSEQWLAMFGVGVFVPQGEYQTPPWLLALREGLQIGFVVMVALSQRSFWRHRTMRSLQILAGLLVVGLVGIGFGEFRDVLALAGLITGVRYLTFFALPIAVYVFLRHAARRSHFALVFGCLFAVVASNAVVSALQSQLATVPYLSYTTFGVRAVGISTSPNTAASLAGLGALLLLFHRRPWWLWMVLYGGFVFTALLTGSRTGIVGTAVLATLAVTYSRQKRGRWAGVVAVPLLLYLISNLSYLSGRQESIEGRGGMTADPRIDLLVDNVARMDSLELLGGRGVGYATNLGFRWARVVLGDGVVPATDSLITLTLLQFGLVGSLIFFLTLAWFLLRFASIRGGSLFLLYILIFGATQNILEAYPSAMLFGILLGYWAAERESPWSARDRRPATQLVSPAAPVSPRGERLDR